MRRYLYLWHRLHVVLVLLALTSCGKPVLAPPAPEVRKAIAIEKPPALAGPTPPPLPVVAKDFLTKAGLDIVYEFEVGGRSGYNPRPEAPDWEMSGITWGIGYDAHQMAPTVILQDWEPLGSDARRLAATHPFYGGTAKAHLKDVHDIIVSWNLATKVFNEVDVAREFASGKRLWPGFADLRPNAQAALISQAFNRGWSTVGANRREMAEQKRLTPLKDYEGMAVQMVKSIRVWEGRQIYNGMHRRRLAEAKLMRTP